MNRTAFVSLIESAIGTLKLWVDIVPEKESIPALTYTHITEGGTRLMNGKRVGTWDTWRVRVISDDRAVGDSIIKLLKALDNTKSGGFRRVTIENVQAVPSQPNDIDFSSLVDFRTID